AELRLLEQLYPEYPQIDSETRRLQRLDEQKRALDSKPVQRREKAEGEIADLRATQILGQDRPETQQAEAAQPLQTESSLHSDVHEAPPTPLSGSVVASPLSFWSSIRLVRVGLVVAAVLGAALVYR